MKNRLLEESSRKKEFSRLNYLLEVFPNIETEFQNEELVTDLGAILCCKTLGLVDDDNSYTCETMKITCEQCWKKRL